MMSDSSIHNGRGRSTDPAAAETPRLRADARRNRDQILAAAREVFADQGPGAPLEEVALRAGVGIATLYRRFADRQALLRAVTLDVLARSAREARLALAEEPDAFQALARYMHRALDLRIGVVMPELVKLIPLEEVEIFSAREASSQPIQAMIAGAQAEGTLRADVAFGDIGLLIIRLGRPLPAPFTRDLDTRIAHRHLDLLLDGLRAAPSAARLPAPAMTLADLQAMSFDDP
jgi:AcrR family transcriptional regulator